MLEGQPNEKLHAACDECRTRKLKCSGELPRCFRCKKENIGCIYSPQKQMGRPRKRRRDGDVEELNVQSNVANDFGMMGHLETHNYITVTPPISHDVAYPTGSSVAFSGSPSLDLDGSNTFGISPNATDELGPELAIDPSLWSMSASTILAEEPSVQAPVAPCTCLSLMYLTLTELQNVSSFAFPQIIVPLRKAMGVLSDIIHCPQCPKEVFSAIQNIQSISALFQGIIERFQRVLLAIDKEAAELEQTGARKPFRIGDANPALLHLHTDTPDCPMGFNIEFEAKDWKRLVKTALKTEVHGNGSNPRPLMQLLKEAIERQKKWHSDRGMLHDERKKLFGEVPHDVLGNKCHALGADRLQIMIDHLKWED